MKDQPAMRDPQKRRALFLDRDGVVNQEVGYLSRPDQLHFLPDIFPLCQQAQALGYLLIIVTNQAGIARGYYSEEEFHALMLYIAREFSARGIHIEKYYFCPHHPEHGMGAYRIDCQSRKPNPGMLLQAANDFDLDLAQSIFIGDRCTDMAAGHTAGVGTLALLAGTEKEACPPPPKIRMLRSLPEAMSLLKKA